MIRYTHTVLNILKIYLNQYMIDHYGLTFEIKHYTNCITEKHTDYL